MNSETYERNPAVVDALKKIVPVVVDEAVPDELTRLSVDVKPEHAARVAAALKRETDKIERAERIRVAGHWDPMSGTPNPKLSGPGVKKGLA